MKINEKLKKKLTKSFQAIAIILIIGATALGIYADELEYQDDINDIISHINSDPSLSYVMKIFSGESICIESGLRQAFINVCEDGNVIISDDINEVCHRIDYDGRLIFDHYFEEKLNTALIIP